MQFSTIDNDNDLNPNGSCANAYDGACWYNRCYDSNLNGLYLNAKRNFFLFLRKFNQLIFLVL